LPLSRIISVKTASRSRTSSLLRIRGHALNTYCRFPVLLILS
jgi:hypothetical protein